MITTSRPFPFCLNSLHISVKCPFRGETASSSAEALCAPFTTFNPFILEQKDQGNQPMVYDETPSCFSRKLLSLPT